MKLKYDCPAPSKFGNDLPLWKTATTCFLRVVTECAAVISELGEGEFRPEDVLSGFGTQ